MSAAMPSSRTATRSPGRPYEELFDLKEDPEERRNLWDEPAFQSLRCALLHRFVQAEMEREPTRMPRIAGA